MLNKIVYLRDPHPSEPIIFNSDKLYTKRILLTTTSLVLAAGVAQADVSFSGKGEVSVAAATGADTMSVRSGYDLDVAVSGASDNGITYSMGFDMGAGSLIDYNDDYAIDAQGETIGTSALTLGYAGLTIVAGQDKVDDLYDDAENGDIGLSGSFGGLDFSVVADTDSGASSNSFSLSGASDGLTWSVVSTDSHEMTAGTTGVTAVASIIIDDASGVITTDPTGAATAGAGESTLQLGVPAVAEVAAENAAAAKIAVGYTVSDALSLSFKHDTNGTADAVNTLGATYAMGSLTLGLSGADNDTTDYSVGYAAGPLSVAFATDESDNWEFNSTYNLGGGAQAFVSTNSTEFAAIGMSFAF